MKKYFKSTALALTLTIGLQGCGTTGSASSQTAAEAPPPATLGQGPALWKVADEDTTIYLFGTVHALPEDSGWYAGPVKTALETSGSLVTELDTNPESLAKIRALIASKGVLTNGDTLRGLMTDEQRALYEARLAKFGIPAEAFDQFKPWLAVIQIAQGMAQSAGFSPESGAENVLEKVTADGIERVSLETPEFQIGLFDDLPIATQVDQLIAALDDPQAGIAMLKDIVDQWKVGNAEALGEMLREAASVDPAMTARIFYDRNKTWAGWVDDRLDQPGIVFVAVGAGHLAGEKSVQDYLGQRGVEVTRVQ